ncbi:MAG: HD domain-containing protein [Candidatus Mariimomonas ferrooxydans]
MDINDFECQLEELTENYLSPENLKAFYGRVDKDGGLFLNAPAACGFHSAFEGGLLVHTTRVMNLCAEVYREHEHKDSINIEILMMAALMHDYGKAFEYDKDEEDKFFRTETSKLQGHIYRSAQVAEEIFELPRDAMEKMVHCILAHHGRLEFGSPVEPKCLEAVILHCCDYLDAHLNGKKVLENVFVLEELKK